MEKLLTIVLFVGWVSLVTGLSKKGVTVDVKEYQCKDTFALSNVSWWCYILTLFAVENKVGTVFNEPNHKDQSHMTPEDAAVNWPKVEHASGDRLLMSPAPARCVTTGGLCTYTTFDWLDRFFKACKGCRVDYMAVHSYTCNVESDMGFVESVYRRYNRKVWLTEFACPGKPSLQAVQAYMQAILPRLEKAEFVTGYAWFTSRITRDGYITTTNSLLEAGSSTLTPLGRLYNSLG